MERPYLTLKQMAEVLNMSGNEVLELCKKNQIPHRIADKGTVWEAYFFIEKDVLTALGPREIKEEEPEKEPEPEKSAEEEAKPEPEKSAEEQGEGSVENQPQPEQTSEKTEVEEKDPFEEAKKEKTKKDKKKK